jgi:hypothetical protein
MHEFPRKHVFLNKWNNEMIKRRDSMLFYRLDEKFDNRDDIILLYAFYYLKNQSFYVTQIFDDEFKIYRDYKWELNNIKDVLEKDFLFILTWALHKNIQLSDIFKSEKYSILLRMFDRNKISIHSLICFNKAFHSLERINESTLNMIENEKFETLKKLIDKYTILVYKYFNFNSREFLRNKYQQITEN